MESEETPVNTPPTPTPAPAPVTAEHISALHKRIDEIGHMIKTGFEAVFRFIRKEAPAVEAAAAAASTVVPGVGPVAKVVAAVAGEAAAVVNCANAHGNPCLNRQCVNFNKETPPAAR